VESLRIATIGIGFMGGSFLLALKESGLEFDSFGVDINPKALKLAKERGIISEGDRDIKALREYKPELVVIATPVRTFRSIGYHLRGVVGEECVITDLGSVKGKLVHEMEDMLGNRFVGAHPIAGTEKSGVEHSFSHLFRNKKVILTPTERTDRRALSLVKNLWESVGARVEFMEPFMHDYVFGAVSHLPHAVAFALIDALIDMSREGKVNLFLYPGGGFKDFTRIAASDPVMWRDIFLENRKNILSAIDHYINSLQRLRGMIEQEREKDILEFLREAKDKRLTLEENM
jgi:prephenate dehydrogenase